MSTAQDAIKTFSQQWYNALVTQASLDPATFQLAQGSISLGTTSVTIWEFFNSIPPASINNDFNPSAINSFAQTYLAVVNNLLPQTGNAEREILGDKYAEWVAFQKDNIPSGFDFEQENAALKLRLAIYNKFSVMNGLDQGTTNAMRTVLNQLDVISHAQLMCSAANPNFAYTATIARLNSAINSGQKKTVQFNSKTQSSDTSNAWAKGNVSGPYGFFSAKASAEWNKFTEDISSNGFDLEVTFAKLATLVGGPYSAKTNIDTDLSTYKPWYYSPALNTAYKNNNNKVWKHGSPTWDDTFGSNGSLKRMTTAIIVVDGITSKMTTKASVSSDKHDAFKTAAKAGYFPFFKAEGAGGWSHDVKFNADGSLTVTSSTKEGNPNVLGFLVTDITSSFSQVEHSEKIS